MLFTSIVYSLETEFRWFSPEGAPQNGQCFEIDKSTQGQRLSQKVSRSRCKPLETYYNWIQKEVGVGQCMEFDSETGGMKYFDNVSSSKCITKNVEYRLIEKKCYAYDEKAYQNGFILKVSDQFCRKSKEEVNYIWENDLLKYDGKCYEVAKEKPSNYKFKVSNDKCTPKKVTYIFKNVDGKQICIGIDSVLGESNFASKVDINKCKSNFKYELANINGKANCYRVLDNTFEKVNLNLCKPDDLKIYYVKKDEVDGECFHISNSNPAYREKIDWKKCLPQDKAMFTMLKRNKGDYCIAKAKESEDIPYSFIVSKSFCDLNSGDVFFQLNDVGYGGKCLVRKQDNFFQTNIDLCRPKKTVNVFQLITVESGNCYEVDSKDGHKAFSKQVSKELCKPAKTSFILRKIKDGMTYCYEIGFDNNYINRVDLDKCKKNL